MAIETPPLTSPRISFSHDLSQSDINEQRLLRSLPISSSSSVDFDFCIRQSNFDQQSSSAEDLFSDGKILPIDPKLKRELPPLPPRIDRTGDTHGLKSNESVVSSESDDQKQKSAKSSFWQFKRSSSLNCGSGTLCPIPLLSRSNSTGSSCKKDVEKKNSVVAIKQSQSSSHQKLPLKKNGYGNGVRVNPVLNVNLFGLGSIFSGNKEKNKKK